MGPDIQLVNEGPLAFKMGVGSKISMRISFWHSADRVYMKTILENRERN